MISRKSPHEEPLLRLVPLLEAEDHAGLEQALLEIGLAQACGRDFIDYCRMRRESPLVILLTTLGVANGVNAPYCQRILDLYQSASSGRPEGFLAGLPANHVLRQALDAWRNGKELPLPQAAKKRQGRSEDFELALEFLFDHDRDRAAVELFIERWQGRGDDRHRLTLVELMLKRQGVTKPEWAVLEHWNRAYQCAHAVLTRVGHPSMQSLREQIGLVVGENFLRSPRPELALQWVRGATSAGGRIKALYNEAHARCRLNEMGAAVHCMDEMLKRMPGQQLDWIRKNFRAPGGNSNAKRSFDLEAARHALSDLHAVLEPIAVRPFLVSGTLLGHARCGNFLSHDKDIDVGIFAREDGYRVLEALIQSGLFRISTAYMRLEQNYNLVCWHLPTGMPIDIFVYHQEGDRLVTGVRTDLGYLQRFFFSPFELQEIEFVGVRTYAPLDTDLNLRENFGDWTLPDPHYISHLESPSTEAPGGDVHMMVARLMMFKAIIKESPEIGRRVLTVLRRHADSPWAMEPALMARLESHYGFGVSEAAPPVERGAGQGGEDDRPTASVDMADSLAV